MKSHSGSKNWKAEKNMSLAGFKKHFVVTECEHEMKAKALPRNSVYGGFWVVEYE